MTTRDLSKYIPHRDLMVLIDEIVDDSKDAFCTRVIITEKSVLYSSLGVPSYCAIEYMAQSVAAYNSIHFENRSKSKIGFIIAVRSAKLMDLHFKKNQVLDVFVMPEFIINNSGTFVCKIISNEKEVSFARITAYAPTDDELHRLKERPV